MSDLIHLLPDSIANQIAAGEVIQRPASVVKELVENALDAQADTIRIYIKDAGRTLIQVIDNGTGMSETDARMAFERHATSKISAAADLFSLRTMGFRGEALASIAAVAQVELRTRKKDAELGIRLSIAASEVQEATPDHGDHGSNFSVKNLFFNIPVRRKFLKSNEVEFRHIMTEFERIALVYPHLRLYLYRDETEVFNLPSTPLRQRIVNIFGKNINPKLLPVDIQTTLASITGFISRPDASKKRSNRQYFFVNGRYMKHPYFHKAIVTAYEQLIPSGEMPEYFIYFTVDPSSIDVNIHPTKTEIKFENEQPIWQILLSAVRESIGKLNAVPAIDFNAEDAISIPVYTPDRSSSPSMPTFRTDRSYNPFKTSPAKAELDWQTLYRNFEQGDSTAVKKDQSPIINENHPTPDIPFFDDKSIESRPAAQQHGGRYIIATLKSGLALIDQRRAHISILYEKHLSAIKRRKSASQQLLFPEILDLSVAESLTLSAIADALRIAGFDLSPAAPQSWSINGIPAGMEKLNPVALLRDLLAQAQETETADPIALAETVALALAKAAAIPYGKVLAEEEMSAIIASLFSLPNPQYAPDGKLILFVMPNDEMEKIFG